MGGGDGCGRGLREKSTETGVCTGRGGNLRGFIANLGLYLLLFAFSKRTAV